MHSLQGGNASYRRTARADMQGRRGYIQPGKIGISINIVCDDNQINVTISDTGKGFSMESLEKTTGLGLKLIRERVELLGGTFDIDAEIGQGCKVNFNLPIMSSGS